MSSLSQPGQEKSQQAPSEKNTVIGFVQKSGLETWSHHLQVNNFWQSTLSQKILAQF